MTTSYTVSKRGHKLPFWSVDDDYAFALGMLCMTWSALDHALQETFQWMLGADVETTAIIAGGLDRMEARSTPIKKLLVHHAFEQSHAEFINNLLNRITVEIAPTRNRLIHDRWWLTGEGAMKRVDRRASLKKVQSHRSATLEFNSAQVVKIPEIERLADYIRTVEAALWHLNIQLDIWRNLGWPPRFEKRWSPASKPNTRLIRHQSDTLENGEWPEESDFQTD